MTTATPQMFPFPTPAFLGKTGKTLDARKKLKHFDITATKIITRRDYGEQAIRNEQYIAWTPYRLAMLLLQHACTTCSPHARKAIWQLNWRLPCRRRFSRCFWENACTAPLLIDTHMRYPPHGTISRSRSATVWPRIKHALSNFSASMLAASNACAIWRSLIFEGFYVKQATIRHIR